MTEAKTYLISKSVSTIGRFQLDWWKATTYMKKQTYSIQLIEYKLTFKLPKDNDLSHVERDCKT